MQQGAKMKSSLQETFLSSKLMAAGDGTLKIDLMKPALYEETFIRSVEYITITIIMPKKQQQQHLIFSLSLCVWDRRGEAHFSPCIVMILSEVPQL